MATPASPAQSAGRQPTLSFRVFLILTVAIILAAVLRSAIATRLDSFTLDEGYHIVAGVSYVQRGDFRINPEHPPLVKLWVGSIISALGFHLSPFREVHDKSDERAFTDGNVWTQENNPYALQHHARIAMWVFNGILLLAFSLSLRRLLSPVVALATLLFLAIDPTVAAHLPIVMTDLPVALLSATAIVLAARAFRTWRWPDLGACAIALGFTLSAKHSAPVFCIILALAGFAFAFLIPLRDARDFRSLRCAKVFSVLLAAVVILWGFYRFRFTESPTSAEVFNRPMAEKIADLRSPAYRFALTHLASWHLLPRAYLWGLADTVRAGLEGRLESRLVWGRPFLKAPWYFFPSVVLVKLPLGLLLLVLLGLVLFLARRLPDEHEIPAMLLIFAVLCFFFVLLHGADYAGMRHTLPAVLLLSIFAGFAVQAALASSGRALKVLVAVGFFAAALSALPALRPWEYFNELVGGAENAYLYFNDEGLDVYQRHHEAVRYYHEVVKPTGEIPFIEYLPYDLEAKFRGLDWVGRDIARDEPHYHSPIFTGTIMVEGRYVGPRLFSDWSDLRSAKPVARFGNLFIYRGTYNIAPLISDERYYRGTYALFAEKPDLAAAESLFCQSVEIYPQAFWSFIELGNIYLSQGKRDDAQRAYTAARDTVPSGSVFVPPIENQLRLLNKTPLGKIPALRDPALE